MDSKGYLSRALRARVLLDLLFQSSLPLDWASGIWHWFGHAGVIVGSYMTEALWIFNVDPAGVDASVSKCKGKLSTEDGGVDRAIANLITIPRLVVGQWNLIGKIYAIHIYPEII